MNEWGCWAAGDLMTGGFAITVGCGTPSQERRRNVAGAAMWFLLGLRLSSLGWVEFRLPGERRPLPCDVK